MFSPCAGLEEKSETGAGFQAISRPNNLDRSSSYNPVWGLISEGGTGGLKGFQCVY